MDDMTPVMNKKVSLWIFMTVVIKCHLAYYDTFNAKETLFELSSLWQLDIDQDQTLEIFLQVFALSNMSNVTVYTE